MTTLQAGRLDLGGQLGGVGRFTATGGTTQTVVCAAAFASDQLPASALTGAWAYFPGSVIPKQRRISSLTIISGTITLEGQVGSDIDGDDIFEIHTKLPAIRDNAANLGQTTTMGLHENLRIAARQILVRQDDYSVTLVNGQRDYPVPWWLDRDSRLIAVRQQNALGNDWVDARTRGHNWELREGADGNILHFFSPYRFSGTHTVRLVVDRPGDTLVKLSGSNDWTESTTGPVAELDEVAIDLNAWSTVALALCYRTLRDANVNPARAAWERLYRLQVPAARGVKGYDATNDIDPTIPTEAVEAVA